MKIKSRNQILNDIIKEGENHPKGWKAVFGKDYENQSRDCYLFNPNTGIYLIKEYQKNPYQIKGLGGKIARYVDEDVQKKVSEFAGDFGIIQGDIRLILRNINKGIHPQRIFNQAFKSKGKKYGLTIPIRGNSSMSENSFNNIRLDFLQKQKKLDLKFQKIASDDALYNSYG